jgi:hypothetical protein
MREFEAEYGSSTETKEVQDAILMGLRYKEAYEKLLWEKNVLISCLCSNKTKVIKTSKLEQNDDGEFINTPVYCVLVAPLEGDVDQTPAVWGMDAGELVEGYACYSPYSAVQFMLSEMKKWEDEDERTNK